MNQFEWKNINFLEEVNICCKIPSFLGNVNSTIERSTAILKCHSSLKLTFDIGDSIKIFEYYCCSHVT